jgi:hypothetical protein
MLPLMVLLLSCRAITQPASGAPVRRLLWQAPKAMTVADWIWGPGGAARAPRPPFSFVRENLGGTNPKVDVRDAQGSLWIVKFGGEVHTDTFATRLLSAVGYAAEPTYYVAGGVVTGVHGLKRAKPYFTADGRFHSARFKLRDDRLLAYADEFQWSWTDNPFLGSHELSGLKILIMLASNWDTKDARDGEGSNTAVFLQAGPAPRTYWYAFTDWGASLGSWGGFFKRDRWDPALYERQTAKFVEGVQNGYVVWGFRGKHSRDITEGITVEDVGWLAPYLARITDQELRAGLMASGASEGYAGRLARSLRARIRQLQAVAGASAVAMERVK